MYRDGVRQYCHITNKGEMHHNTSRVCLRLFVFEFFIYPADILLNHIPESVFVYKAQD